LTVPDRAIQKRSIGAASARGNRYFVRITKGSCMPRLTISLFGTPRIAIDGAAASFDRNKPTALLAYLALTGQPHPRSALALLLWPESANARTHLRSTLLLLRRAFG